MISIIFFCEQGMNLVDFFAVAPAYIELALSSEGGGFAVLRILRLARIFRVVKVGSFKENLDLVIEALRRSKSGLLLMVYLGELRRHCLFVVLVLFLCFSSSYFMCLFFVCIFTIILLRHFISLSKL